MDLFGRTGHGARINAALGWGLIGVVALSSLESALTDAYLWGGFTGVVVAISSLPALWSRDWTAMVPWLLLLTITVAVVVRSLGMYPETAGYVAVATLATIGVIELDVFTRVDEPTIRRRLRRLDDDGRSGTVDRRAVLFGQMARNGIPPDTD